MSEKDISNCNNKNKENGGNRRERRSNRKKALIAAAAFALVVIGTGMFTYSRYSSEADINAVANAAKWSVKVNGEDFSTSKAGLALDPDDIEWKGGENVVAGKAAPGSVGVAKFEIDPSGSEVAIDYGVEVGEITGMEDGASEFVVKGVKYTIVGSHGPESVDAVNGVANFSETLYEVTHNLKVAVEVELEWKAEDSDDANAADTKMADGNTEIKIPVVLTAKQKI